MYVIDNYKKILICLMPIVPHFSSEAISDLKIKDNIEWPNYDESLLIEETIPCVIQINGKKRSLINAEKDLKQELLFELVKKDKLLDKYLKNISIKKIIFVKNRLMNILI